MDTRLFNVRFKLGTYSLLKRFGTTIFLRICDNSHYENACVLKYLKSAYDGSKDTYWRRILRLIVYFDIEPQNRNYPYFIMSNPYLTRVG